MRSLSILIVWIVCGYRPIEGAEFAVATRDDVLILTSKLQATQFLTHATFGATQAEIDQLAVEMRQMGTIAAASAWIERQTNESLTPATLHLPKAESMIADDLPFLSVSSGAANPETVIQSSRMKYRQFAWWHNVITGQDQLRQKTAWALTQVFSIGNGIANYDQAFLDGTVSTPSGPLPSKTRYLGLPNYYDLFVKNAFGSFREVAGRVTYHSIMGDWLSYRGNRRAQNGTYPDENYAREVMQLFTIGLYLLNDDGSQQTNALGAIPTYDANNIREYAEVFTGLGFGYGTFNSTNTALNPYSPYTGNASANPNASIKYQVPMRMAPDSHDRSSKILLNGLILNNPNGPNAVHTETTANAEIDAALDGLINHQSCPPFISRLLIQRLVKSNPSRAYLQRVVSVFKNNGAGIRGDLKAVVKAILLDPEAWQPIRVQFVRAPINKFVVSTMGTEDSRLQEPVLNYTRFTRFFKGVGTYEKGTGANVPSFVSEGIVSNDFRLNSRFAEFEQSPYETPSVFNFYLADYQPAGEIAQFIPSSRIPNGMVIAPEFQIVNAITTNSSGNFFRDLIIGLAGTPSRREMHFAIGTTSDNHAGIVTTALKTLISRVVYDFSTEQAMAQPGTSGGIDQLIERLDLYLCGGTMSNEYKAKMKALMLVEMTDAGGPGNISANEARDIAKAAILGTVTSPSFLVTE